MYLNATFQGKSQEHVCISKIKFVMHFFHHLSLKITELLKNEIGIYFTNKYVTDIWTCENKM